MPKHRLVMKNHVVADAVADEVAAHDAKREPLKAEIQKQRLRPVTKKKSRPTTNLIRSPRANQAKLPRVKKVNPVDDDDDDAFVVDQMKWLLDLKSSRKSLLMRRTTKILLRKRASLKKKMMKRSSSLSAMRGFLHGKRRFHTCSDVHVILDRVPNSLDAAAAAIIDGDP